MKASNAEGQAVFLLDGHVGSSGVGIGLCGGAEATSGNRCIDVHGWFFILAEWQGLYFNAESHMISVDVFFVCVGDDDAGVAARTAARR